MTALAPIDLNRLQAEMLAAYRQGRYITGIRAAWGSGKSFGLGLVAALAGDQRPGDAGVWVTDTRSRLESVVQPVCEKLLRDRYAWRFHADPSKFFWQHPTNGFRLYLRPYYRASTRTQDQNPLEGFNGSVGLVDEASALRPEALVAVQGRIRTVAGDGVIFAAGLPIWNAWWIDAAEKLGPRGATLYATTHVNAQNLDPNYIENLRATLSPEMFASRVENQPFAPVGQVLNNWGVDSWPRGNILDGWRPDPAKPCRIAVDFGRRSPHVVLIQSAVIDVEQADVMFGEVAPDECLVGGLCERINAEADRWGVTIQAGAGDPAGKAVNDQTGVDSIDFLARPRARGGVGVRLRYETDPIKRHIPNGIERLRRRILGQDGVRRLVMTREMWDAGERQRRSLRRCIEGYRYPEKGGDMPVKDDVCDHGIDAIRYDALVWHWHDAPTSGRIGIAATKPAETPTRASAIIAGSRPRLGGR